MDHEKTWSDNELGLDRRLTKALAKMGFIYPTLVQATCIPLSLEGRDLLVRARTGSGKTAAYGIPMLQKILIGKANGANENSCVRSIILVPTRELCDQV